MTHSGGKPHAVGDRGQRYEVLYVDVDCRMQTFGWCDSMRVATSFCKAIRLHPSMSGGRARDRLRKRTVMRG